MLIRAARGDDFVAITTIQNHYIATSAIHFAYAPLADDELHAAWVQSRDRFPWFVAEDAGTVVGFAKAGTWRERAAYQWTAEIGLYIAHDATGRGLGRALYAALLAELPRRGFRSAIAGITLPNDPSVALHRAFDFTSVGIVREAGFKLDRWWDVEFWQKHFATAA